MLAGIVWPFVLLLGLMMAILLLGALVGWPLMWATVSVEGTDAFDALSRSYAYTYQRPLRLLWYVLFAGLLAIVSMFVVKLFATSAIALGDWSVDWGLDEDTMRIVVAGAEDDATRRRLRRPRPPVDELERLPMRNGRFAADCATMSSASSATRPSIDFWKSLSQHSRPATRPDSSGWRPSASTCCLRRDIDGVQMNEVYVDQADGVRHAATRRRMPPRGVPEVALGPSAGPNPAISDLTQIDDAALAA